MLAKGLTEDMKHPIVDGDMVSFLPTYGSALVTPIPTTITGTAEKTNATGAALCLEGDEEDVESAGCMYIAPPYVIPGSGTLKIDSLASDQLTENTTVEGKKVILKGVMFDAIFTVDSPATDPSSGSPDSATEHSGGQGMFTTANTSVEAQ